MHNAHTYYRWNACMQTSIQTPAAVHLLAGIPLDSRYQGVVKEAKLSTCYLVVGEVLLGTAPMPVIYAESR